ncbi:hypothetical protein CQ056_05730, partial [Peribacillus simplex]
NVSRGDPAGARRRGGFPDRPRKASCQEWKSTFQFYKHLNTVGKIKHYRVCRQMGLFLKGKTKLIGA